MSMPHTDILVIHGESEENKQNGFSPTSIGCHSATEKQSERHTDRPTNPKPTDWDNVSLTALVELEMMKDDLEHEIAEDLEKFGRLLTLESGFNGRDNKAMVHKIGELASIIHKELQEDEDEDDEPLYRPPLSDLNELYDYWQIDGSSLVWSPPSPNTCTTQTLEEGKNTAPFSLGSKCEEEDEDKDEGESDVTVDKIPGEQTVDEIEGIEVRKEQKSVSFGSGKDNTSAIEEYAGDLAAVIVSEALQQHSTNATQQDTESKQSTTQLKRHTTSHVKSTHRHTTSQVESTHEGLCEDEEDEDYCEGAIRENDILRVKSEDKVAAREEESDKDIGSSCSALGKDHLTSASADTSSAIEECARQLAKDIVSEALKQYSATTFQQDSGFEQSTAQVKGHTLPHIVQEDDNDGGRSDVGACDIPGGQTMDEIDNSVHNSESFNDTLTSEKNHLPYSNATSSTEAYIDMFASVIVSEALQQHATTALQRSKDLKTSAAQFTATCMDTASKGMYRNKNSDDGGEGDASVDNIEDIEESERSDGKDVGEHIFLGEQEVNDREEFSRSDQKDVGPSCPPSGQGPLPSTHTCTGSSSPVEVYAEMLASQIISEVLQQVQTSTNDPQQVTNSVMSIAAPQCIRDSDSSGSSVTLYEKQQPTFTFEPGIVAPLTEPIEHTEAAPKSPISRVEKPAAPALMTCRMMKICRMQNPNRAKITFSDLLHDQINDAGVNKGMRQRDTPTDCSHKSVDRGEKSHQCMQTTTPVILKGSFETNRGSSTTKYRQAVLKGKRSIGGFVLPSKVVNPVTSFQDRDPMTQKLMGEYALSKHCGTAETPEFTPMAYKHCNEVSCPNMKNPNTTMAGATNREAKSTALGRMRSEVKSNVTKHVACGLKQTKGSHGQINNVTKLPDHYQQVASEVHQLTREMQKGIGFRHQSDSDTQHRQLSQSSQPEASSLLEIPQMFRGYSGCCKSLMDQSETNHTYMGSSSPVEVYSEMLASQIISEVLQQVQTSTNDPQQVTNCVMSTAAPQCIRDSGSSGTSVTLYEKQQPTFTSEPGIVAPSTEHIKHTEAAPKSPISRVEKPAAPALMTCRVMKMCRMQSPNRTKIKFNDLLHDQVNDAGVNKCMRQRDTPTDCSHRSVDCGEKSHQCMQTTTPVILKDSLETNRASSTAKYRQAVLNGKSSIGGFVLPSKVVNPVISFQDRAPMTQKLMREDTPSKHCGNAEIPEFTPMACKKVSCPTMKNPNTEATNREAKVTVPSCMRRRSKVKSNVAKHVAGDLKQMKGSRGQINNVVKLPDHYQQVASEVHKLAREMQKDVALRHQSDSDTQHRELSQSPQPEAFSLPEIPQMFRGYSGCCNSLTAQSEANHYLVPLLSRSHRETSVQRAESCAAETDTFTLKNKQRVPKVSNSRRYSKNKPITCRNNVKHSRLPQYETISLPTIPLTDNGGQYEAKCDRSPRLTQSEPFELPRLKLTADGSGYDATAWIKEYNYMKQKNMANCHVTSSRIRCDKSDDRLPQIIHYENI